MASKLLDRSPLSLRHVERYFSEIASKAEVCMAELNILHYLRWDASAFTALDFVKTALQLVPDAALKATILARAEKAHYAALLGARERKRRQRGSPRRSCVLARNHPPPLPLLPSPSYFPQTTACCASTPAPSALPASTSPARCAASM